VNCCDYIDYDDKYSLFIHKSHSVCNSLSKVLHYHHCETTVMRHNYFFNTSCKNTKMSNMNCNSGRIIFSIYLFIHAAVHDGSFILS